MDIKDLRKELGVRKTDKRNFRTLTVTADIHCDGDVYILCKSGNFRRIGCLSEPDFGDVPNTYYKLAKKLINR